MKAQAWVLFSKGLLLGTCVLVAGLAWGQAPAGGESGEEARAYKIGVVDRKEVFDAYERTKQEYEQLQKEVDERQKVVTALSDKVEGQKDEYEQKKETMSDEEREELESQIESDFRLYRSELNRLQGDIDKMEERVVKKLFRDVNMAIEQVGAEGNYHLVLDGTPKGGVLYYSPTLNMTQKVVDYINSDRMESSE